MEAIVEKDNLREALARVKRNKGAPGIDGMSVEALASVSLLSAAASWVCSGRCPGASKRERSKR